jgi:hypothetical protein
MSLKPETLWRVKQLKKALGVGDAEVEAESLIGKRLKLVLGQETFGGEPQVRVKRFKKA